jgi:hypothetical protein
MTQKNKMNVWRVSAYGNLLDGTQVKDSGMYHLPAYMSKIQVQKHIINSLKKKRWYNIIVYATKDSVVTERFYGM